MLIFIVVGVAVGWTLPWLIVSKWRNWWAAVASIALAIPALLAAALLSKVLDTAPSAELSFLRFGAVFWVGLVAAVFSAIRTVRQGESPRTGKTSDESEIIERFSR